MGKYFILRLFSSGSFNSVSLFKYYEKSRKVRLSLKENFHKKRGGREKSLLVFQCDLDKNSFSIILTKNEYLAM